MKHNPHGTIRYKPHLVIERHAQTDFGENYALVGKLTTFRYHISLVGRHGWNIDHFDVFSEFFNPEVNDNDMYVTLHDGWPEGLNAPAIVVRLKESSLRPQTSTTTMARRY